ncbi:kinase-like protein [Rhypophila decipiens]|uniref:Kinase-like protein n=1 Tax=Rhypophila decipiens TaxID=261697 RepID=A0AAN6YDU8_9PEZI|nr:kinase-like protein [Rhypophila decipiens]
MVPQVTSAEDLTFIHEECDEETGNCHTTFAYFDKNDTGYFGNLSLPKHEIKLEQLAFALTPVPDEHLFPEWAGSGVKLTEAPETSPFNIYIKRPSIVLYDVFREHDVLDLIPKDLLEEAKVMEMLSQHPHPHVIRYHGCHVRRHRIVGLVLDRHSNTLADYLKKNVGSLDESRFMQALKSAIYHLHSIKWTHNDLHPNNIMVDESGGQGGPRGAKGWIEGEMKDYHTSDSSHDLFALEKLRTWLESPAFND